MSREHANQALDDAIEQIARLRRGEGADRLRIEDYHARAISIRDYVMRMSNPDPLDPAAGGGGGGGVTAKCPHCHKDIVVTVSK